MIEQTDSGPWSYTGDASTIAFSYHNIIWASSDLRVTVNDVLVSPTEYSVTGVEAATGGNVVFNTAPAAGAAIKIISAIPETQETAVPDGKILAGKTRERALDRIMRTVQQVRADAPTSGGGGGDVISVFGRTGAVVAQAGDYNADQITETEAAKILTAAERTKLAGVEAGAQVNYPGKHSIEVDASAYQLVGDVATPADFTYYGMIGGARSWYRLPLSGDGIWDFDSATTAAFPGQGNFRLNSGAWATTTQIYVAGESSEALDLGDLIEAMRSGQLFRVTQANDEDRSALFTFSGDPIKAGTAPNHWYTLSVTLSDEGSAFLQTGQKCQFSFFGIGGVAAESQRGEVTDIVTVSTTTHTLAPANKGAQHELTNAAGCAVTVPPDSTVIPIKAAFYFAADAAGAVTFLEGTGVTIKKPTGKQAALRAQGSGGNLIKIGINTWRLQGDLLDV